MGLLSIAAGTAGLKIADGLIKGAAEYFSNRPSNSNIGSNQNLTEDSNPNRYKNTTKKCVGCHAKLAGLAGDTVKCVYCDTIQTLSD